MAIPSASAQPAEFGRIDRLVIPAEPHFQRDRYAHGRDRGADERDREANVAHQMRSGIAIRDFFRRAAHVDVDHRGAGVLRKPRRFRHDIRLAAGDLHHMETHTRAFCSQPVRRIAAGVMIRGDHLGDRESGAKSMGQPAHAEIGDTRHRCKKSAPLEQHPANAKFGAPQKCLNS